MSPAPWDTISGHPGLPLRARMPTRWGRVGLLQRTRVGSPQLHEGGPPETRQPRTKPNPTPQRPDPSRRGEGEKVGVHGSVHSERGDLGLTRDLGLSRFSVVQQLQLHEVKFWFSAVQWSSSTKLNLCSLAHKADDVRRTRRNPEGTSDPCSP
jgi:hypothetical protein